MGFLLESTVRAVGLITSLDREFISIVLLSLRVSGLAVLFATITGVGIAFIVYRIRSPFKKIIVPVLNTSMGLPPVVVGLFLYLLFSRSGPLGELGILYTPTAMVIAQWVLATPIVAGISHAALASAGPELRLTALSLGATEFQSAIRVAKEMRYAILSSVVAGLGRVIAEVGAVLIVGGNIAGYTRVMTTAIALEADRGDFTLAIALGIVLLLLSLIINLLLYLFQKKGETGDK
ncbi:MAG: ABC transporter permease subunit [Nitrospirae bacterium]|nr:MAG: ABC transporter permease subunit [Nitrospirota bacterium]